MFSNRKNKEKEAHSVSASQSHQLTQTNKNVIIQQTYQENTHQRSQSVSYYTNYQRGGSGSQISLPALSNNLLPSPSFSTFERPKSSYSTSGTVSVDAKPVNINYQSPSAYKSFHAPRNSIANSTPTTYNKPTSGFSPTSPSFKVPAPVIKEPKKLIVKKTGKVYDNDDRLPTYKTSSKNRGEVLIINNIMFSGALERKGAKVDEENLRNVFKQIGFQVTVKCNLKAKDIKWQTESFSKKSSLKSADISVLVIMSHGTKHDTWGTQVFGCDEKGISIEQLLTHFNGDKCKHMQGKPKIFIFQCCRGDNEQFIQNDAIPLNKPRPYADMLIAYSTLPGFVSHRDQVHGTWYIQTLCEVFSEHAHEYHVEELLKIVDVRLAHFGGYSSKQTSSYESRGFQRCYLHPK